MHFNKKITATNALIAVKFVFFNLSVRQAKLCQLHLAQYFVIDNYADQIKTRYSECALVIMNNIAVQWKQIAECVSTVSYESFGSLSLRHLLFKLWCRDPEPHSPQILSPLLPVRKCF